MGVNPFGWTRCCPWNLWLWVPMTTNSTPVRQEGGGFHQEQRQASQLEEAWRGDCGSFREPAHFTDVETEAPCLEAARSDAQSCLWKVEVGFLMQFGRKHTWLIRRVEKLLTEK